MEADVAISILKNALLTGAVMMAPILMTGLVIGITVAAVQAATQVNEPTLTFVPKALGVGLVGGLIIPWMLDRMVILFQNICEQVSIIGGV